MTHADAVGHCDGAELKRNTTGVTDAFLCMFRQSAQGHVARRDFVPGRCNAHLGLLPVIVGEAHCTQHCARCRFLVAVCDVAAAGFDIDGGAV